MTMQVATKELHHRAEQHEIGAAMARGDIDPQFWADWLASLHTIHVWLDPYLTPCLRRTWELEIDLAASAAKGFQGRRTVAAMDFISALRSSADIVACTYVFTGAHLMGGAIQAQRIGDRLPTRHLQWKDRREALDAWRPLRNIEGVDAEAIKAFGLVTEIMDEIVSWRKSDNVSHTEPTSEAPL